MEKTKSKLFDVLCGDRVSIKYWEFEDAPLKEKLKDPTVREVAKIYFDNETRAYRFALALMEVKKKGSLRLKECGNEMPLATWKRYLDFGVTVGLLKHEGNVYGFTDRYSKPFRNIPVYIKSWVDGSKAEDLSVLFATAKTGRQMRRGGRAFAETEVPAVQGPQQKQESGPVSQ